MLYAIVVGLIAGWLAGQVMKGGGYGVVVDILLGLVGGVVGNWVLGSMGIWPGGGCRSGGGRMPHTSSPIARISASALLRSTTPSRIR